MRIAINTSSAVAGGAITHLRHLLPPLLAAAGPDSIVAIGTADVRERLAPPRGIEWVGVPGSLHSLPLRLRWENFELPRILGSLSADVLFHPANFPVYRAPIPQVTLVHNVAPFLREIIAEESVRQRLRLRILRHLTLGAVRRANQCIFISEWGRALVLGGPAADTERYPVIPFGSEHVESHPSTDVLQRLGLVSGSFLLTVSHLYRYKRLEYLIDAHATRVECGRPLVVVGEPFDRPYAEALMARSKAAPSPVLFTGALGGPDVFTLMKASALFVFTSEAENLPITLLEAMAAGCAIVTNRSCSMPETCADAVRYVETRDSAGYGEAIRSLMEQPDELARLRAAARARGRSFSWDEAARLTLAALRRAGSRS